MLGVILKLFRILNERETSSQRVHVVSEARTAVARQLMIPRAKYGQSLAGGLLATLGLTILAACISDAASMEKGKEA